MALYMTGTVLGKKSELVEPRPGGKQFNPFVSKTIFLLDGVESTPVQAGRDLPASDFDALNDGDVVTLAGSLYRGMFQADKVQDRKPASGARAAS